MHSKKEAHMEEAENDTSNRVDELAGVGMARDSQRNRAVVGGAYGKVASHATTTAKWTFLVYMAGDNNLDGAALRDIEEMARAGSTKDVNILVQLDRIEDNLTRRFRITQGGGFKKDCIETFGDTNTGDPQILYDFVKWAAGNYPADRYALILWNHGSGWWEDAKSRSAGPAAKKPRRRLFRQPVRYPVPQEHLTIPVPQEHRSICYDDTSGGDALDNRELRVVLAGICALLGRKIDLLGMDACLITMLEVAYQIRDHARVLVGSEEERIAQNRHNVLSTYGLLSTFPKRVVRDWTEQLVDQGCLERTGEFNVLRVTERGWRVLRGQETPRLLKAPEPKRARARTCGVRALVYSTSTALLGSHPLALAQSWPGSVRSSPTIPQRVQPLR